MKFTRVLALALALVLLCSSFALAETFPLVTEPTTLTVMAQVGSYYPEHGECSYSI